MKGLIKFNGKFLGVEPGKKTVHTRDAANGGWEGVEFIEHDDKVGCDVRFLDANVFLCLTPDGKAETRPSGGGAWETFSIAEQLNGLLIVTAQREGGKVFCLEAVKL